MARRFAAATAIAVFLVATAIIPVLFIGNNAERDSAKAARPTEGDLSPHHSDGSSSSRPKRRRRRRLVDQTPTSTNGTAVPKNYSSRRQFWYTYPHPSGNRVLPGGAGRGTFPHARVVDVELESQIAWVVGTAHPTLGFRFVVTTLDGRAFVVQEEDGEFEEGGGGEGGGGGRPSGGGGGGGSESDWVAAPLEGYVPPPSAYGPPLVRTHVGIDDEGEVGPAASSAEAAGAAAAAAAAPQSLLPSIVTLPGAADRSELSHPVPASRGGTNSVVGDLYVYIATNGDLVLWDEDAETELARLADVNALPDGRLVVSPIVEDDNDNDDGDGGDVLLALYGGATDAYRHCVLGDCTEGTRLVLVRVTVDDEGDGGATMTIRTDVTLPDGSVYEGLCPFFLPDGRTIVTTIANDDRGAWLQTYDVDGAVQSVGPHIGWGWRHMLFYNDFGSPTGDPGSTAAGSLPSLVDVLTPHVRMVVEFFDISRPAMAMRASTASLGRYTTHSMNSRYLDTAISADLNGDCVNEAVVLDSTQTSLVGIQLVPRTGAGPDGGEEGGTASAVEAAEVWRAPLPGMLSSNLAAVSSVDGTSSIAVGAGAGSAFRMWLPPTTTAAAPPPGGGEGMGEASSPPSSSPVPRPAAASSVGFGTDAPSSFTGSTLLSAFGPTAEEPSCLVPSQRPPTSGDVQTNDAHLLRARGWLCGLAVHGGLSLLISFVF